MSINRILAHVVESDEGCWIWVGTLDKSNPMLRVSQPKRKLVSARRYAYEAHNQVSVPPSFVVTSICKNSLCCNPAHLTAQKRGTHSHRLVGSWKVEYCQNGHEFSQWNTGTQNSGKRFCIVCDKTHAKQYAARKRLENPEYERQLRLSRIAEKQDIVQALKALAGCSKCGETDPDCLDFHHKNPEDKIDTISTLVRSQRTKDAIFEEIKKCDILCANCHRKLHAAEKVALKEAS